MKISSNMKPGDVFGGKYRLVQQIGEGNMGAVWSGENLALDTAVALKFVLNSTRDLRQRLLREAKACGSLSHPNIVKLYDVGETDCGDPFLVLELLTGETLGQMIKAKRRIEPPIAARIAKDIASALSAAHKAKFIHRDLKPANIFLHRAPGMAEGEFVVKVLDFGVSKHIGSNDGLVTATNAAVGSPAYMSPEQVCVRKDVDHRTDIWSLGIVLYEMLTGARPFEGSMDQVVRNILLAEIVPPSSRVRSLPPEFDGVVNRCLDRDRGKRVAHADDLVRMLGQLVESSRSARVRVSVPGASAEAVQDVAASTLHSTPTSAAPAVTRVSDSNRPVAMPVSGTSPIVDDAARRTTPLPLMPGKPQFTTTGTQLLPKSTSAAILSGKSSASPTETAFLDPMAPVGDPFAALRLERQQALAAYRQSTLAAEAIAQGGTMAISADVLEKATTGVAFPGRNSGLAHQSGGVGAVNVNVHGQRRRKDSGRIIFASIAIGVLAVVSLVGVLIASSLWRNKEALGAVENGSTIKLEIPGPSMAKPATPESGTSESVAHQAEPQAPPTTPVVTPRPITTAQDVRSKPSEARRQSSSTGNSTPGRSTGAKKSASVFSNPLDAPAPTRPRLFN